MNKQIGALMKKTIVSLTICAITLLPHCGKYKPATMQKPVGYEKEKEKIKVVTKKLSPTECRSYFDSDSIASNYIPVHIFVKNKSEKTYNFDVSQMSLPVEKSDIVAHKTYHSSLEKFMPNKARKYFKSKEAETDFYSKVMGKEDNVLIAPNTAVNKIVFIPKGTFRSNFNLQLIDTETKKELSFDMWT